MLRLKPSGEMTSYDASNYVMQPVGFFQYDKSSTSPTDLPVSMRISPSILVNCFKFFILVQVYSKKCNHKFLNSQYLRSSATRSFCILTRAGQSTGSDLVHPLRNHSVVLRGENASDLHRLAGEVSFVLFPVLF